MSILSREDILLGLAKKEIHYRGGNLEKFVKENSIDVRLDKEILLARQDKKGNLDFYPPQRVVSVEVFFDILEHIFNDNKGNNSYASYVRYTEKNDFRLPDTGEEEVSSKKWNDYYSIITQYFAINQNSVDVNVHDIHSITSRVFRFAFEQRKNLKIPRNSIPILVPPKGFFLGRTIESIGTNKDSNLVPKLHAKSTFGRRGSAICLCAGLGEVGYASPWTLEVHNMTPFWRVYWSGSVIGQVTFEGTNSPTDSYYNGADRYQDGDSFRMAPKPIEVYLEKDGEES
jgi:deoxycytidine triphosphate deaminase